MARELKNVILFDLQITTHWWAGVVAGQDFDLRPDAVAGVEVDEVNCVCVPRLIQLPEHRAGVGLRTNSTAYENNLADEANGYHCDVFTNCIQIEINLFL